MTNITIGQTQKRLGGLSEVLRETIFSVQTAEIIGRICEQNNLPDDKVPAVAKTTGLVLLGFIHPEEVSKEISEQAGISNQAAQSIADSLDNRIFRPIRDEIDEAYAPAIHEAEPVRILTEIQSPSNKTVNIAGSSNAVDLGDKLSLGASAKQSVPSVEVPGGKPAPFMLHEESGAEISKRTSGFDLGLSKPIGVTMSDGTKKTFGSVPSPRPAQIVIGREEEPPKPKTPATPKVINYTETKTPLQKVESELPSLPKPTAPAQPSFPPNAVMGMPKPPAPPAQTQIKVPPIKITPPAPPMGPPKPPEPQALNPRQNGEVIDIATLKKINLSGNGEPKGEKPSQSPFN